MTDHEQRIADLETQARELSAQVVQLQEAALVSQRRIAAQQRELDILYESPPYVMAVGGCIALIGAFFGGMG